MAVRLGIMQGRLVPPVGNAIQAFPAENWREEFPNAQAAGLQSIEWIYDVGCDTVNPIATDEGIAEMRRLGGQHHVAVGSLCADYFMAEPLLRGSRPERAERFSKLMWLFGQCAKAGIGRVVLPFVDHSRIDSDADALGAAALLKEAASAHAAAGLEIHLETSLPPERFAALLQAIDEPSVKVNYDSGNSASLGFRVEEEFAAYGLAVGSVHIKDRVRGGTTVPLGSGGANFAALSRCLQEVGYTRDIILQVARGESGQEVEWARQNRAFVLQNISAAAVHGSPTDR